MWTQLEPLMVVSLPLEVRAVPSREGRRLVVGRFEKCGQLRRRGRRRPHRFIRQDEVREVVAVKCAGRPDAGGFETGWFWRRVRIERRLMDRTAARPETMADD